MYELKNHIMNFIASKNGQGQDDFRTYAEIQRLKKKQLPG
jgi:hypothetical protein